jgi:putative ABC transport system substrate-binding protein
MRRRAFLAGSIAAVAAPRAADAQQVGKVARIGWISAASVSAHARGIESFRNALHELGYVDGKNISIEYRFAEGKLERLSELAAELVRHGVDVIVATGNEPVRAAKKATRSIPVVMAFSADPVADGFVASLARPGGNVTGLTTLSRDLSAKRLELLREAISGAARVAIFWSRAIPSSALTVKETESAARAIGVQLHAIELVGSNPDFERAFRTATTRRADALIVVSDAITISHRARIVSLAAKNRLPTMYTGYDFALEGGLMTYGPNMSDNFRRVAVYVDKILKGAKPGDLPVEQPTKFELVINLKAAKALGLTIPPSLRLRADQVIE